VLRALTKKRTDGRLYQRPAAVTQRLQAFGGIERASLGALLRISDRRHPDYLPSECLVYLLREAVLDPDQGWFDRLCSALLGRCAHNLRWSIRAGTLPDAESVREEILGAFALRLAEALRLDPERLDPFEVMFDLAFVAFRRDQLRRETKRVQREPSFDPAPSDDSDAPDRWVLALRAEDGSDDVGLHGAEYHIFRNSVFAAIDQLPESERVAITLRLEGIPLHSDDPATDSISRRCQVDERTIRNRIKSGVRKLQRLSSDDVR
jgi:DNA-directed RNA polymerase specialized sigma24 family protein